MTSREVLKLVRAFQGSEEKPEPETDSGLKPECEPRPRLKPEESKPEPEPADAGAADSGSDSQPGPGGANIAVIDAARLFALSSAAHGMCVVDGFLGAEEAASLSCRVRERGLDDLAPARMGAQHKWRDETARGDRMAWVTAAWDRRTMFSALFAKLRLLQAQLRRNMRHMSDKVSVQLAAYPGTGEGGYVRHSDVGASSERLVTALFYLNPGWSARNGGQLRVFLPQLDGPQDELSVADVLPVADRLVLFRSDVEHQVLPCRGAERWAVTCWFHGTKPLQPVSKSVSKSVAMSVSTSDDSEVALTLALAQVPRTLGALRRDGTIFVAIPCFRDAQCQHTIADLLATADRPELVSVGVCWQLDVLEDAASCLGPVWCRASSEAGGRVRAVLLDAAAAAGPCVARHLVHSGLFSGEEFVLNIDAHARFRKGWDSELVGMLEQAEQQSASGKPILTTYPAGFELDVASNTATVPNELVLGLTGPPVLEASHVADSDGLLRVKSRRMDAAPADPQHSKFWAAGFNFARAFGLLDDPACAYVPVPGLFYGEEALMGARLWMQGFDFFAPQRDVTFHLWSRAHRPVFQSSRQASRDVADALAGRSSPLAKHLQSHVPGRSLEDYNRMCSSNSSSNP